MKTYISYLTALLIISSSLMSSHSGTSNMNRITTVVSISNCFMQPNQINTCFRSDGIFNSDFVHYASETAGLIWPVSASVIQTADFASGLWIAAKVSGQIRTAACLYASLYSPGNIPVVGQVPPSSVCSNPRMRVYLVNLRDSSLINGGTRIKTAGGMQYSITYDAWSTWPVDLGAPYVEVNGVPGYQPSWNGDRPGSGNGTDRPDEVSFTVYMDYTNCTDTMHASGQLELPGGTLPMGVEVQQVSYGYNVAPLQNMFFMRFKIINKSSNEFDSTYISLVNDADLGYAFDDDAGCDSTRDLGFIYNNSNNDPIYGASPPAVGFRILQGPLIYTGNSHDTASLPCKSLNGYKMLHMSGFNLLSGGQDCWPINQNYTLEAYNLMKGLDPCGNRVINPITGQPTSFRYPADLCNRSGWYDTMPRDERYIMNMGPLTMVSEDTQIIAMACLITRGSDNLNSACLLKASSDSALKYYYSGCQGSPIGIHNVSSGVPKAFALYQNYPNPFNPTTKIKFDIPSDVKSETSNVRLVIYDVLGRIVATLVNQPMEPGSYSVDFDGTNYPSGVYFYRLTAGSFTESKKMILLK